MSECERVMCMHVLVPRLVAVTPLISTEHKLRIQKANDAEKNLKSKKKTGATNQEHEPTTYYNTAGPAAAATPGPFTELRLT